MTTKTITIRYTKSDTRCLFTCTAGAANVLAVGGVMAIVALAGGYRDLEERLGRVVSVMQVLWSEKRRVAA